MRIYIFRKNVVWTFDLLDQSGVFSFSITRMALLSDPRASSLAMCERSWTGLVVFDYILRLLSDPLASSPARRSRNGQGPWAVSNSGATEMRIPLCKCMQCFQTFIRNCMVLEWSTDLWSGRCADRTSAKESGGVHGIFLVAILTSWVGIVRLLDRLHDPSSPDGKCSPFSPPRSSAVVVARVGLDAFEGWGSKVCGSDLDSRSEVWSCVVAREGDGER